MADNKERDRLLYVKYRGERETILRRGEARADKAGQPQAILTPEEVYELSEIGDCLAAIQEDWPWDWTTW